MTTPTPPHPTPVQARGPRLAALTRAAALGCATLVWLGVTAPADAQVTTTQRYEFLGWTSTGHETIRRVTVGATGMMPNGDPVNWSYTVLEIGSISGGGVSRFRVGAPEGETQSYWEKSKPEEEGLKRIQAMGLRKAIGGAVSPNGAMALVTLTSQEDGDMAMTGDCPGCQTCRSTITVMLYDRDTRRAYQLSQQSHAGAPYPPGSTRDCPTLTAQPWWHPESGQVAIIYDKVVRSSGEQSQRLDNYTLPASLGSMTSRPLPTPGAANAAFKQEAAALSATLSKLPEDDQARPYHLIELGDLYLRQGQLADARRQYAAALTIDRRNARAELGLATILASEGQARDAKRMIRKVERADRREGRLSAEIGLYYLAAGDLDKAQEHLQKAVGEDMESGASFEKRLKLGYRILELDLSAGLAYMDNLLSQSRPIRPSTAIPNNAIDPNTADQAGLESIPGVDVVLAQAILADRELKGAYGSLEDLKRVTGMEAVLRTQCHRIVVNGALGCPPPPDPASLKLRDAYVHLVEEAIHAGDMDVAGRYLARLDPNSPDARRLALLASASSPSRAAQVLEKTTVLLYDTPEDCSLLLARGLANLKLTRPADAFENLAAATICDPNLTEAHVHLGNLYSRRNMTQLALRHYNAYLEETQPRRGDPIRARRLGAVNRVLPKLEHSGVVLLDHTCQASGDVLRCEGVLLNTAVSASGPVAITLTATDRRKRSAAESSTALPNIKPGASLDFKIALSGAEEDHTVVLTAGRNDPELEINRTIVQ